MRLKNVSKQATAVSYLLSISLTERRDYFCFDIDIFRFLLHTRQMMLSCRRVQPIPQDFEHAVKRSSVHLDDLILYMKYPSSLPAGLATKPQEEEEEEEEEEADSFDSIPLSFLGADLNGERDRTQSPHIPKHFPEFPSRHTYRHTPVFTEREQDPRKIRQQATEDGRHGEEALRKLARAASQDTRLAGVGREKKLWGRRMESMESMFEKTVKGLSKRLEVYASETVGDVMDEGPLAEQELRPTAKALEKKLEIGPIINCDRDFWRRTTASGGRRAPTEERPSNDVVEDEHRFSRVDSWVST